MMRMPNTFPVGASLLAMEANDNARFLSKRVAPEFIASNRASTGCSYNFAQPLAAIAVTSTRMPSTASDATPTAARTGHGLAKKRLYTSLNAARSAMSVR